MNRISKAIAAISVVALLAIALAPQASAASPYQQQILQVRYDLTTAHVNFMSGVMADTVNLVPQASDLNAHIATLTGDLAQLQGYVSSSDRAGFNAYMQDTVRPDLKTASDALRGDKSHFREWGVNNSTKLQLLSMYQARKATFDAEVNEARVQLGQIRLSGYNDAMARSDSWIGSLAAKGIDVTDMQSLRTSAQSGVVDPLQASINTGNAETIMNEVKSKSLFNGAPYSFHYAARMDLAALTAVTDHIETNATQAGYGDDIAEVRAKLASAQSTLTIVGTNPYADSRQEQIFGDLKAASQQLRTIIQAMNGGVQS